MNRPTKTINTPIQNHVVVLYEWITGGDKKKISAETEETKRLNTMVSCLVISIDDKKGADMYTEMDNMHGKDFDFILIEMNKIIEESSLPVEKKTK